MTDMAYIVNRTLETKIAIAENNGNNDLIVTIDVLKEILALLKEQEAVKPILGKTGRIWLCGNCGSYVGFEDNDPHDPNEYDKYCRECGRPVLWKGR